MCGAKGPTYKTGLGAKLSAYKKLFFIIFSCGSDEVKMKTWVLH